jgi:hypothetical protein
VSHHGKTRNRSLLKAVSFRTAFKLNKPAEEDNQMKLLEGLYLHEVILMVLGALLFVVLLVLLVYSVLKNRDLKLVLLSFLLPVLMIGFSSVKKIQFDKLVVDLEHQARQLEQKPGDQQLRAEVEKNVATVTDARPIGNRPDTLVIVARAQNALGQEQQALDTAKRAVKIDPSVATRIAPILKVDPKKLTEGSR